MFYRVSHTVRCDIDEVLWRLRDFNQIAPLGSNDFWGHPIYGAFLAHVQIDPCLSVDALAHLMREDFPQWQEARSWARQFQRFYVGQGLPVEAQKMLWWGVPDNAELYEFHKDESVVYFNTAHFAPFAIMERLSFLYPQARIVWSWAEENLGFNAGLAELQNGVFVQKHFYRDGSPPSFATGEAHWGKRDEYVFGSGEVFYCPKSDEDD